MFWSNAVEEPLSGWLLIEKRWAGVETRCFDVLGTSTQCNSFVPIKAFFYKCTFKSITTFFWSVGWLGHGTDWIWGVGVIMVICVKPRVTDCADDIGKTLNQRSPIITVTASIEVIRWIKHSNTTFFVIPPIQQGSWKQCMCVFVSGCSNICKAAVGFRGKEAKE